MTAEELRNYQKNKKYSKVDNTVKYILEEVLEYANEHLDDRSFDYYTWDYISADVEQRLEELGYKIEQDYRYKPEDSMCAEYLYIISW